MDKTAPQETYRPADKRRSVILNVGKTGCGKTLLTIQKIVPRFNRVFILDPQQDYEGVLDFDNMDDMLNYVADRKVFRVKTTICENLPDLCNLAWVKGDCALIIDEAALAIPPGPLDPAIKRAINLGRHRRLTPVIISQRAADINIKIRAQFTELYAFWQTEPADIDWIERVSPEQNLNLNTLQIGEYYHITPKKIQRKTLDIPQA